MLLYNFSRIFKARGIARPFTYLRNAGFSGSFTSKVIHDRVRRMDLKHLERLCLLLHCTPNDVLEWVPEGHDQADTKHPMNIIRKSGKNVDLVKAINDIPLGKLEAIEKMIQDEIATVTTKEKDATDSA